MNNVLRYRLLNLSKVDVQKITAISLAENVIVETPQSDELRHNELVLLALVGGISLLQAAASYYFGKTRQEDILLNVQEIHPDGTTKTLSLKINRLSKDPVKTQIAKALVAAEQGGNQQLHP